MYVLDSTIGCIVAVDFLDHTQDDPNGIAHCRAFGRVTEVHNNEGYIRLIAWETPGDSNAAKSNGETSFCIAIGVITELTRFMAEGKEEKEGESE